MDSKDRHRRLLRRLRLWLLARQLLRLPRLPGVRADSKDSKDSSRSSYSRRFCLLKQLLQTAYTLVQRVYFLVALANRVYVFNP